MATYFESVNDAYTAQISDSYKSYALWKKGRITSRAGPASITKLFVITFAMPPSGNIPIVVFDTSPGTGVMVLNQTYRNGVATINAYSTDATTTVGTMTYYVYLPSNDPAVVVQPRGLFTLWDEQGRVVFDSEANYLKVLDQFEHFYYSQPLSKTYPVKKIGVVSSKAQWYVAPGNGPGQWLAFAGCAVLTGVNGLPNAMTAGYYRLRATDSGNQFPDPSESGNSRRPNSMRAIICDISNLDTLPYDIIQ